MVDNVSNLGTLLPGTGTSTLTYRITNQSAASQQVTAVAVSVPADGSGNVFDTVTSGYKVGCLAAWFTPDNAGTTFKDNANTATTIPKTLLQNGYITGTTSVTMGEPGVNQDACKLVSPRLIVTVS